MSDTPLVASSYPITWKPSIARISAFCVSCSLFRFLPANYSARNLISHNHQHVIEPDYNTPFNSYEDALDRLLPYHVYQQPVEDTHVSRPSTSLGDDTVLDFYARRQKIYDRFRKAREFDVIHKSHSNFLLRQVNSHIKDDNVRLAQQIRDLKGVPGVSTTNRSATSTPAPSTPANNAQIPLTLPYTRLGQLMSLGITPVPIANVQNGDSPACVLHSVIENRGMVHLVVNFGSLNPRQLNTLAQLLRTCECFSQQQVFLFTIITRGI